MNVLYVCCLVVEGGRGGRGERRRERIGFDEDKVETVVLVGGRGGERAVGVLGVAKMNGAL